MGRLFVEQVQLYNVGYLLFGRVDGRFVDAGRPLTYDLDWITERIDAEKYGNTRLHSYSVDAQGKPLMLLGEPIDYAFQKEAWYDRVIQTKQAGWTPIYTWQSPSANPLAIAFSSPVYDRDGQLIGAVAVEQRLLQISDFLAQLGDREISTTFIVEQSGQLVASSSDAPIVDQNTLIQAVDSTDPLVQQTAQYIETQLGGWQSIAPEASFRLSIQGQRQFVYATSWQDVAGLDWFTVIMVPESRFLKEIHQNIYRAIGLSVVTLLLSMGVGLFVVQRIIGTITRLNQSALAIAGGDLDQELSGSSIRELDLFSQSFNHMTQRLQESFALLTQANLDLEHKVEARTAELAALNQKLQHLSITDELTQLPNRRSFNQYLWQLWSHCCREPFAITLILMDIDCFKQYNDFYGHPEGDRCLQRIAEILQATLHRSTDLIARYGGEEFVVVLPYTDAKSAIAIAESMQQAVAEAQIPHGRSPISPWVTLSFGIASVSSNTLPSPDYLIKSADDALYLAKQQGRNRIHLYGT